MPLFALGWTELSHEGCLKTKLPGEKSGGWGEERSWVAGGTIPVTKLSEGVCWGGTKLKLVSTHIICNGFHWIFTILYFAGAEGVSERHQRDPGGLKSEGLSINCQSIVLLCLSNWSWRFSKTVLRCTCNTSSRDSGWKSMEMSILIFILFLFSAWWETWPSSWSSPVFLCKTRKTRRKKLWGPSKNWKSKSQRNLKILETSRLSINDLWSPY